MLLDTDMTITNSPDASSSQVHNLIKNIGNAQQHISNIYGPHSLEQHFKMNNLNSVQFAKTGINYNNSENQANFLNRKTQKTLPNITTIRPIGNSLCSKVNMAVKGLPTQLQFNPYADENDSSGKFQLSKSVGSYNGASGNSLVTATSNLSSRILNRSRFFGNDRTNLMPIGPNRSSGLNLRRENFYTFNITNNMVRKTSNIYSGNTNEQSPNSQLIQENPVMFRNYDLNDEYWLNFE